MSPTVADLCPQCGAPLELTPEHTCRWCHTHITLTAGAAGAASGAGPPPASASDGDGSGEPLGPGERWTLRPGGPAIDWQGAPGLPVLTWRAPLRDLMFSFRDGVGEPWVGQLAADENLDRAFCRVVSDAAPDGLAFPTLCSLVPALVSFPGTNRDWAKRISAAAQEVEKLLTHESDGYVSDQWKTSAYREKQKRPEELRLLAGWVDSQAQAETKHHHLW